MKGAPVAGDWDGDGDDNVGTFDQGEFFLDTNDNFSSSELVVQFPDFDFGGLKPQPVAGDWDQDGDDDIGLFVVRETGSNTGAREAGEWFLDVNTDLSGSGTVVAEFEPPLTGLPGVPFVNQDIFFNFGDEREPAALGELIPITGNFDPPVTSRNPSLNSPGDVNGDGIFDSSDLVQIFRAGEYEDGIDNNSTFAEGDWNGDGDFDSSDLVLAFQSGYVAAAVSGPASGSGTESIFTWEDDEKEKKPRSLESDAVDAIFGFLRRRPVDWVIDSCRKFERLRRIRCGVTSPRIHHHHANASVSAWWSSKRSLLSATISSFVVVTVSIVGDQYARRRRAPNDDGSRCACDGGTNAI